MSGPSFAARYDPRRNNFDALRFLLATLVVWSHAFPLSGRPADWVGAVSRGQASAGSVAVDGFFVLSGFLVAQSWLARPRLVTYAWNRALRIGPALLAAVVFGAFVVGPLVTTLPPRDYLAAPGTWLHLLAVVRTRYLECPGVFARNPLPALMNGSLWSLRYELAAYAFVALLGSLPRRYWTPGLLATAAVAWGVDAAGHGVHRLAAHLLGCFVAGMLFFTHRDRVPWSATLALVAGALVAATLVGGGFRLAFAAAGGYLLLFAAFAPLGGLARFARHGDFSYGIYVFAFPVEQTLVHLLGRGVPVGWLFVLSFIAVLPLAALSWYLVEAPALARKRRVAAAPALAPLAGPAVS